MKNVLLTTTLYEKNFRQVLTPENWFFRSESDYFIDRVFIVNNVNSREEFDILQKKFQHLAKFVWSDLIWKESLSKFNSEMSQNEIGYWYSIQHFCSLYHAIENKVDYVFSVGSDCTMSNFSMDDFIEDSIKILKEDKSVLLTTIPWCEGDFTPAGENEQGYHDIKKRSDKFYFSHCVSDQVFFTSPQKIIDQRVDFNILKDLHPFPGYGGNSFEKRFCNYLITSCSYRAVYKKHHYIHKSF